MSTAKEKAMKEILPGQFYCEHVFHMADDRPAVLPKDWKKILDFLNGVDLTGISSISPVGPVYRVLGFRWLKPDTYPGIFSLN